MKFHPPFSQKLKVIPEHFPPPIGVGRPFVTQILCAKRKSLELPSRRTEMRSRIESHCKIVTASVIQPHALKER